MHISTVYDVFFNDLTSSYAPHIWLRFAQHEKLGFHLGVANTGPCERAHADKHTQHTDDYSVILFPFIHSHRHHHHVYSKECCV